MARLGVNPARGKTTTYQPAAVTVAILTYIPHLDGYFRHRLDVLKLVFTSLLKNTAYPHDVFVFDNGSCPEVVDYLRTLRDSGGVDYLYLSRRNLGKIGAFKILSHAVPGEYVAYADDDILFYPGWLSAAMDVMNTFPHVGMVSSNPVRNASLHARTALDKFAQAPPADVIVTYERIIPDDWEADWAVSTGRDLDAHQSELSDHQDMLLEKAGVQAIGGANHFQFLARKSVYAQALPTEWSGQLMGQMVELDNAIDHAGYLRLSTRGRFTRHLGNVLSDEVLAYAAEMDLDLVQTPVGKRSKKPWFLHIPGAGRILWRVYHWLFRVLFEIE